MEDPSEALRRPYARELDAAVAAASGWPEDISNDNALARLLDLNSVRSRSVPAENWAAAEKAIVRRSCCAQPLEV